MNEPHQPPDAPRRTDPLSFVVRSIGLVGQLAIPLAIAAAGLRDEVELSWLVFILPIVLVVVGINVGLVWLGWRRFTYRVGTDDIRVEHGIVSRASRSVPYERIQDVSLEQKFIPRLFGLVEVRFETGAGGKDELKLAYLSEPEGERLRELVRARKSGVAERAEVTDREPQAAPLFAMGPKRVLTFGLFEFSLAVVAVVGGFAQQFEFLLPFDPWDFDGWQERLAGPGQWLAGLGVAAKVAGGAIALASLAVLGFATGILRTALREWDFRLDRTDKGLRRRRGLLTRTDVVMPVRRIQALRIGTGILRRRFGWHGLSIVSLAQDSGQANHDAAPFARMSEIEPIVAETGFALPASGLDWRRGSARARRDSALAAGGAVAAIALGVLVALSVTDIASPLFALVPIGLALPLAALLWFLWRFEHHAIDGEQLFRRSGWLAPRTTIGSRPKLQSVEIRQGPIARRRGYATLHLGLAGGRFAIEHIPLGRARELRGALLHSMAEHDFGELA